VYIEGLSTIGPYPPGREFTQQAWRDGLLLLVWVLPCFVYFLKQKIKHENLLKIAKFSKILAVTYLQIQITRARGPAFPRSFIPQRHTIKMEDIILFEDDYVARSPVKPSPVRSRIRTSSALADITNSLHSKYVIV
jgi:hypothetical protein